MGWTDWVSIWRTARSPATKRAETQDSGWSAADLDALLLRSRASLAAGSFADAEADAERLVRLDPYASPAQVALAFARIGQGKAEPARAAAERAIWIDPSEIQGHVAMALAQLLDRHVEQAESAARWAVAIDPESADAHSALAAALEMRGAKREARQEIDVAIALEPAHADGERVWRQWRAPLVGAVGVAGFLAYHALGVLAERFTDRTVAIVLLVVTAGFVVAVLIGLHRQRRRLAGLSPVARMTVGLEARRRRSQGWSELAAPVAIITGVVAALSIVTVLFATGQKPTVVLKVGDCFNYEPGTVISQVATIPCQLPHDIEIFAVLSDPSPPGAPYPGFDALIASLEPQCEALYAGYVGVPYGRTAPAQIQTYAPLEVYWVVDIRSLFCGLRDPAGRQFVGSKRNTGSRPTP